MRRAMAAALICGGAAVEVVFYDASLGRAATVADFAVGATLIACGTIAWERRRESRVGPLLGLAGIAWFLGSAAPPLLYVHRGPLAHLTLSYPTGRLRTRIAQAVVAAAWLDGAIEPVARNRAATFVVAGSIALAAVYGRTRNPAAALAFAAVLALGAWSANDLVLWVYDGVIAAIGIALLGDLLRGGWAEAAAVGLVVDLGAGAETGTLRRKLARALGDPSLVVGYRLADGFVDDAGRPVELPAPGSGRTVTPLVADGEEIGLLVHDEALLADRRLVDSVAAAARIAVANAGLQAEARAQAAALEASRRRIVEAADAQRRQIRAELDRRAGRALAAVASLLADARSAGPEVAELERELVETQRELAQFAHGVRPAVLTECGLMPALAQLAERSTVPVDLDGAVGRLPEPVEAALYFVCSEALANVAKHAAASRVRIAVHTDLGGVTVEIADDGRGGANVGRGSGLAGLTDRVEALGGSLGTDSPPQRGTRLVAWLPLNDGRA
jgi:signal transduction histidine kinase